MGPSRPARDRLQGPARSSHPARSLAPRAGASAWWGARHRAEPTHASRPSRAPKAFPKNDRDHLRDAHGRWASCRRSTTRSALIPDSTGYTPRAADDRIGYFTTVYCDLGKFTDKEKWVRYINRWNLEKRDPKLKMSPPKEPIVFYIDTAVPVRYREAVRQGITRWNKCFEKVGIVNAIEVYQQDEATNQHMDKDAEDVRYNFIRWLSNDQGTSIGPSRTHPLTGQILDADIVITEPAGSATTGCSSMRSCPRSRWRTSPPRATGGVASTPHPQWDPRVRLRGRPGGQRQTRSSLTA